MPARGSIPLIFLLGCGFGLFLTLSVVNLASSTLSGVYLGISIGLFGFFLFALYFFRDPLRITPQDNNLIVSPVDGRVREVTDSHLTIILSLADVHVSRAPCEGKISNIEYIRGKHIPTWRPGAGENQREVMSIETKHGVIELIRIAGPFVRRIVSWVTDKAPVSLGQKIGLIRFGSRCDMKIPKSYEFVCKPGEHLTGAETVIARLRE